MAILATVFLLAVNSMLVVCGAQAPARSPPSAPSCSCSDPVVVSNNLLALAHADKPVTLGQQCTTCNGAFQGAWFKINRSSTARLILLDVCKANQGRPSMLMDVYSASNSSTMNACNASQLAHVASFRVAFGDSTACQIRFLAQAYTIYFVRGWFNASQPLPIPLKCGPALLSLTRQPTKPQAASCRKPIMVDMSAWRPSLTSNVQPMFTFGLGTSTCGKPANESSWVGLRGERDVTYRLKGAHRNMTLTIVVRAEPGHNQGNSPYYTPIMRAFTWSAGQCDSNRTELAAALIGQDVTQYLSENDNGVTSVLQLTVLPKMVTALVITSIGGYDELCGRGAVDIWAENGPHKFIVKGTPSDRKK